MKKFLTITVVLSLPLAASEQNARTELPNMCRAGKRQDFPGIS
jgi:hypothetical protein